MYAELLFDLTEVARRRVLGDHKAEATHYRRALAAVADRSGAELPSEFFHFKNGRPMDGPSSVRFMAQKSGLRIVGVGQAGAELVTECAPTVQRLLIDETKTMVPCRMLHGQNSIELLNYKQMYHASLIVVGTSHQRNKWRHWERQAAAQAQTTGQVCNFYDIPEARALIEANLTKSLKAQVNGLHSGPQDKTARELSDADIEKLRVTIVSVGRKSSVATFGMVQHHHAKAVTGDGAPTSVALGSPIIEINAKLTGYWSVGALQARGHGALWRHYEDQQAAA
jgi:hypothetical protein